MKVSYCIDCSFLTVMSVVNQLKRLSESRMSLWTSRMVSMRVVGSIFVQLQLRCCKVGGESRNCFVNTFWDGVRWAKGGGEFEFCPMKCYQNVDVGTVSLKKFEFCPTDGVPTEFYPLKILMTRFIIDCCISSNPEHMAILTDFRLQICIRHESWLFLWTRFMTRFSMSFCICLWFLKILFATNVFENPVVK